MFTPIYVQLCSKRNVSLEHFFSPFCRICGCFAAFCFSWGIDSEEKGLTISTRTL